MIIIPSFLFYENTFLFYENTEKNAVKQLYNIDTWQGSRSGKMLFANVSFGSREEAERVMTQIKGRFSLKVNWSTPRDARKKEMEARYYIHKHSCENFR